ncbi:MAG: hypothetical protein KDI13_07050 [Alphaproteobacteria bacterium]|nr:hypothetical protein [Alphaproteobacteria bacterium]
MKNKLRSSHQRGSVLFYILIAIVLFAALSYAVANMMRGNPEMLGSEKARVYADDIIAYAAAVRTAVQDLKISNGCAESDISFSNNFVSGYAHSPVVSNTCKVFELDGGGIGWYAALTDVNGALDWVFTGANKVPDVGIDANPDLVMILPEVKKNLCLAINAKLGIPDVSGDAPTDTDDISSTKFTGSYAASAQIGQTTHFSGKLAGCFKNTVPNPDTYNFYQVLVVR